MRFTCRIVKASICAQLLVGVGAAGTASAQDARAPVELPEVVVEAPVKKTPKKATKSNSKPKNSQTAASSNEPASAEPVVDAAVAAREAEQAQAVGLGTKVPQSVQVISRKEIERAQQLSSSASAAIARLVPGYSVSNGTISGASESFRGRDVQVMLDGVVLNTPLRDVSRIIALIDLNTVDRIEVIAGASSLYGSSATGGTINFVTKKPVAGKPSVSVNTSVTAFTENIGQSLRPETSMAVSGKGQNGVDYLMSGTGKLADKTYDGAGREVPSDGMLGQGGGDRYESFNLLGKLGYDFNARQRFEVSGTWIYFDQDPDYLTSYSGAFARPDYSAPYTGKSVNEDSKSFSARFTDTGTPLGKLTLLGFYNDIEKRFNYSQFSYPANFQVYYSGNLNSPTLPANQTVLSSKRGGINATMETPLDGIVSGARLIWGGDLVRDHTGQELVDGRDVQTPLAQTSSAAFAQLQVPLGERLTLRGGVRYEHFDLTVDDFNRPAAFARGVLQGTLVDVVFPQLAVKGGDFTYGSPTYNLGATLKLTQFSELFGGFSQGFNLPDVGAFTRRAGANPADVFTYGCIVRPIVFPNPCVGNKTIAYTALAPETQIVDNYELGIRGATSQWRGSLTGFVSTSENGVSFDPATNAITQQKEEIYGVEFAGEVSVTRALSLGTIFTWREGRYDSNRDGKIDSHVLNNRISSPYRGTVYGDYRFFNDWVFHLEGEWWSDRDEAINVRGDHFPIDGAFLVNAALAVPAYDGQLYFGATNLLDAEFENPTATATRNLDVYGFGRTVTVGYRKTF